MIWSLAMALLTLPSALVSSGAGDPFMSKSSLHWLAPLSIWLGAWFFAKVVINERLGDAQDVN
jgi:hypothetical protein